MQLTAHYNIYRNEVELQPKGKFWDDNEKSEIIKTVCAHQIDVEPEILGAKTRKREIVEARQIAMTLTKMNTALSLKAIGLRYGGRDHSTVIHAKETISNLVETDKLFHEKVKKFQQAIENYCILTNKF